jgi:hypothetical protein
MKNVHEYVQVWWRGLYVLVAVANVYQQYNTSYRYSVQVLVAIRTNYWKTTNNQKWLFCIVQFLLLAQCCRRLSPIQSIWLLVSPKLITVNTMFAVLRDILPKCLEYCRKDHLKAISWQRVCRPTDTQCEILIWTSGCFSYKWLVAPVDMKSYQISYFGLMWFFGEAIVY